MLSAQKAVKKEVKDQSTGLFGMKNFNKYVASLKQEEINTMFISLLTL